MKLAYLTNQYPKVSHTFIRREILALQEQGWNVVRYSIRGTPDVLTDPEDIQEAKVTRLILDGDHLALATAVTRTAAKSPVAFARALRLAQTFGATSDRPTGTEYAYLAEACRLVEWCKTDGIDHLHVHFGTNPATVALLARVLGGPPYSFTVHGPEEFDRSAVLYLREKIERARFVVAISDFGRSQLYRHCPHSQWSKIHVVRCGVDRTFLQQPIQPIPEEPRLVCVGRLSEQKGQLLLLDAAQRCVQRGARFKLLFVGDGELRPTIEERIRELDLSNCVTITGWAPGHVVRSQLEQARALVLTSFAEGLPVVIMEAFARGRPVISTYVAGIPELVVPGKNGWLVPPGSIDRLADALMDVLNSPTERLAELGNEGRRCIHEMHDIHKNAAQLGRLFRPAN
jgi:colanic acid/amylovoran biosynthesis glycosyltransferase